MRCRSSPKQFCRYGFLIPFSRVDPQDKAGNGRFLLLRFLFTWEKMKKHLHKLRPESKEPFRVIH
jgi:hypothetical protein